MKALKLILIAIVVLGAVVGLLFLSSGESSSEIKGDKSKQMSMLKEKINGEWDSTSDWDTGLLERDLDMLKQYSQNLGDGYRTLVDLTGERASHRLDSVMMGEFAKTDCDPNKIEVYGNGLDLLVAKIPSYKNDVEVQKLMGILTLYRNIRKLSKRNLGITPRFKFENDSWVSFASHSQNIIKERNGYKQSDFFQYIAHIEDVKTGLAGVEGRLNSAKAQYKQGLATQIMDAYTPKDAQLASRLTQVQGRFQREFGNYAQLDIFVQNYAN